MAPAETAVKREKVRFPSSDAECVAWHYPGTNGAAVIMAPGFGVPKEPGTDPWAKRFAQAGYSVLAFDYRGFGESGGEPRLVARIDEQIADWEAALAFARTLPEVDPRRIAIWGFCLSGGLVFEVAARNRDLAAAIAHAPAADGMEGSRVSIRQRPPMAVLRLNLAALRDLVGSWLGRPPFLIPWTGSPEELAALGTLDAQHGPEALNPGNKYPDWRQEVAARSIVRAGFHRPGRHAAKIEAPLLVIAFEDDGVTPASGVIKAGERAPRGQVVRFPGGHYSTYADPRLQDEAIEIMLNFCRRHLLGQSGMPGAEEAVEVAG